MSDGPLNKKHKINSDLPDDSLRSGPDGLQILVPPQYGELGVAHLDCVELAGRSGRHLVLGDFPPECFTCSTLDDAPIRLGTEKRRP